MSRQASHPSDHQHGLRKQCDVYDPAFPSAKELSHGNDSIGWFSPADSNRVHAVDLTGYHVCVFDAETILTRLS